MPVWDGKRPDLRPGMTARRKVENREGRRVACRHRGRTAEVPVKPGTEGERPAEAGDGRTAKGPVEAGGGRQEACQSR